MSSVQWANIGDDPGAAHALVERIPEHAPIAAIDYLWLFPARRIAVGESTVVVIGAFDVDPDRRRVSTAHFTVSRDRKGAATVNVRFDEHGSAPVAAIPRIVQGVLRRLGEDTEASPRAVQIGGRLERWDALIVDLGGPVRTADTAAPVADDVAPHAQNAHAADGAAEAPHEPGRDERPASPAGTAARNPDSRTEPA